MKSRKILVNPDDLQALGIDPDTCLKCFGTGALDRKKDKALIARLQPMHEPHGTVQ
jgi:hypothetical protein